MQELTELIVKWKNTVENLLKKVDGDWKKKSCLASPSANGKQKIIVQTELYIVFLSCNDAYTVMGRCLSPWNHMTIESDLPPRVHRSGRELFPRTNWKWQRLNMRRILIPTSVIFVFKGTNDKTLLLVQMMLNVDWVYMPKPTHVYGRRKDQTSPMSKEIIPRGHSVLRS